MTIETVVGPLWSWGLARVLLPAALTAVYVLESLGRTEDLPW